MPGYEIICPYCFEKMKDEEVLFRSEKVNIEEDTIIPEDYADVDDFIVQYTGADKQDILNRYNDWAFFNQTKDERYEEFWEKFNGTTEYDPQDEKYDKKNNKKYGIKSYERKIINPKLPAHQKYIKKQENGSYLILDRDGMVAQIELKTGDRCNRRVCAHCHNPLPDNYGKNKVRFISIIGITGSGKTVYLSQLLKNLSISLAQVGLTASPNGRGAQNFIESNSIVAGQPVPGATPYGRLQQPLSYQLVRRTTGTSIVTENLVLYDIAGEVLTDPNRVASYGHFVEYADGVIVLIDPKQMAGIAGIVGEDQLSAPTTALKNIHRIITHGDSHVACPTPIAVCVSKIDDKSIQSVLSEQIKSILLNDLVPIRDSNNRPKPVFNATDYNRLSTELNSFVQLQDPDLELYMYNNYSNYAFFGFTALGCDVVTKEENGNKFDSPEGPILPKRIEEPLLWMLHSLGYLSTNEKVLQPCLVPVPCEHCGSHDTAELPEDQKGVKKVGFFKKEYVNYKCNECNKMFNHQG